MEYFPGLKLRKLPSDFIKDGWKIPGLSGGFNRKITYFYGPFSSKPCLITGGYHILVMKTSKSEPAPSQDRLPSCTSTNALSATRPMVIPAGGIVTWGCVHVLGPWTEAQGGIYVCIYIYMIYIICIYRYNCVHII